MIHTSSYQLGGKDTDILEHANFSRGQLKRLYEKVYSGFLSPEDLSDVIKGTPFYFSAEQIADRLDALTEYRENQPCTNPDCNCQQIPQEIENEEFEDIEEFSIDQIVEDAVTRALEAFDKKQKAAEKKASRTKAPKVIEKVE